MVTITSLEESNALKSLLSYGDRSYYWMGITNETDDNEWINITGEEFSFSNWASTEPSNTNGVEYYGCVVNDGDLPWNDAENMHAYRSLGFICEYENVEPVIMLGDADGDGEITILDATQVQLHLAQLVKLDENQSFAADTDKSGGISILDVTRIQLFLASIITEF